MSRRQRIPLTLAAAALLLGATAPADVPDVAAFEGLRTLDARLATIAYRLTTGNAALCRDLQPTPGMVLHAADLYAPELRAAAVRAFGFTSAPAVELVVPGGPADRAGVRANDSVVAVDGKALPRAGAGPSTSATRDAANALVAEMPPAAPLRLDLLRDGRAISVTIPASPGCRSAFEIVVGPSFIARSDGITVQIGAPYFRRYTDDQVTILVAHELAHTILRHRARLETAGVRWGVFAEFGKNGRLFRQTETDADLLGVALLYNAGYDPRAAVAFWGHDVGDLDGGVFHSRTHPSSPARARAVAAEIARIPADAPRPYIPTVLATRDQPLS